MNQAIILAAGFGKRLKPLTDSCPKPLLKYNGRPLIEYGINKLKACGVTSIIIHVSYLANMIIDYLEDGSKWDVEIKYAQSDKPIDTGAGLELSMSYLSEPDRQFIAINSDIITNYDYQNLLKLDLITNNKLAHYILTPHQISNLSGDYDLLGNNLIKHDHKNKIDNKYTYTGIALYNPILLRKKMLEHKQNYSSKRNYSIIEIINKNIDSVSAELFEGAWLDVGDNISLFK